MANLTFYPGIHKTWKVASTEVGIGEMFRIGTCLSEAEANATLRKLLTAEKSHIQPSTFVSRASDRFSSTALIKLFSLSRQVRYP